ncbi:MAG: tetrahydromethanopterin S-methyltransferase subunit C [Methanobacteriaceae archaeon]|jgi:tetrahydromethanopterin S-methyltransferase subunit C|nr:tetrahydromethanopterin S-methyltransferase subunit C [Methanobacteriaceae archaeon]MDO9627878.1 tetrahydromethanopterin S-methyltransferase subunit C [Methanobacteriaceae archaeon]MDP2837383.1 tetrahydromethanopterin S-methyltransferase subunit C [Methanobacteriaceae archaeon]
MSVAGGGGGESSVNPKHTLALGVIGGLAGIYLTPISPVLGPLFAALGAVCAIVWGADAIARVASYGLGTGVPSIGYMSLSIGILGGLGGLAGAVIFGPSLAILAPLFGFILAVIVGTIVALIAKKIIKMKIPVLVSCTAELAGASALSVIGFSAAIAGSYSMALIQASVISTGFIALLLIMNTMAIQHPFNACLGPQEDRTRTLKLAGAAAFMAMSIYGLLGMVSTQAWWVIALVGAIGWFISIRSYITASQEQAASVKWSGMWPKEEEH